MRTLLTNHHLGLRGGSELYVWELAEALGARGHDVRIFTLQPGALAEEIRARGLVVHSLKDQAALEAWSPEVVHVHHAPCLWQVGSLKLNCPVVFSSLGVVPAHEAPPPSWHGVALGVAVSEEVQARLHRSPFGAAVPLRVMRNWFDDRGWELTPAEGPPARIQRVAVVTNHLSPELAQQLDVLAGQDSLAWTHFGLPNHSVRLDRSMLEPFDLVITIGRTVLTAAAMGKPVLIADVHGSDGLLDASRLDELASVNFSGRLLHQSPTLEHLSAALKAATQLDVAALQRVVWERFGLSQRAAEWESLYTDALATPHRLDESAQVAYRPLAYLYSSLLEDPHARQALEARLSAIQAELSRHQQSLLEVTERAQRAEAIAERSQTLLAKRAVATAVQVALRATALRKRLLPDGTRGHELLEQARSLLKGD